MKSKIEALKNIANILRRDVLQTTTKAGSGHPTSCLSCAELMSCLFFNELVLDIENFGKPKKSKFSKKDSENKFSDTFKIRDFEVFDEFPSENRGKSKSSIKNPDNPSNDEFILSKGHAAPILYSALYRAGSIKNNLSSLRKFNSPLEGHPLPSLPFIKYATGSLGQGLSIGVGMAIANKLDKKTSRVYVLLGDSELAEGSVYEAFELASYYRLNNLIAIADINRLGQRGETMFGHNVNEYEKRFKGFNWDTIKIDGHNISQILNAFKKARKSNNPTIILAKTLKGKGVSFIEDKNGWHGRALNKEELERALMEIPNAVFPSIKIKKPLKSSFKKSIYKKYTPNCYEIGKQIATREAYGNALSQLSLSNPRIIAVDAEVSNSTFSEKVKEKTPEQFVEAFIAEQNMIGMALGLSKRNFNVFASTFSAFLTRAHDQLRMAAYSDADITFCGSHAGVSIGEDGVSQMGLEDISMFRSLFNSTVLYPCDSVSTEKLVYECSKLKGIKYIRTTRSKTPVIYSNKETFPIGDFRILKEYSNDKLVLIGAGITVFEALKAHEELKKKGINSSVIDLYCIKPFDYKKFIDFVKAHGNKIVISEDHYAEGGIGEMISSHLPGTNIQLTHLAVRKFPHSGKSEQLLAFEEIDANAIVKKAKEMIR